MSENNANETTATAEEQKKAIAVWFHHVQNVLQEQFEDYRVEGGISTHPMFGPVFAFKLVKEELFYSCGFLLNELLQQFRNNPSPGTWISSYYIDMIREGSSKPFPAPPQNEQEQKDLIDKIIVPQCAAAIRSEFPDTQVHVDLAMHKEHGPVLEAGFPAIKVESNTAALPISYLVAMHLMNRDPADPLLAGLYQLYDRHLSK